MKKLILILLLLLLATSCGAKSKDTSSSYDTSQFTEELFVDDVTTNDVEDSISKIEIRSNLSFETKDLDETNKKVIEIIKEYNGVIINENISSYGDNNQYRDSSYEIRIPIDKYEDFINKIKPVATLTNYSTTKNDITKTYIDVDTRIKTLETEETRLNELLKKAETVSDIVVIEDKLTDVRANIESLKSQRDYLNTITDNATITININQVKEYTANISFFERISDALSNSFDNFINVLQNVFIFLIYALPFVLVIGIIIVVIIKIRKRRNGK